MVSVKTKLIIYGSITILGFMFLITLLLYDHAVLGNPLSNMEVFFYGAFFGFITTFFVRGISLKPVKRDGRK